MKFKTILFLFNIILIFAFFSILFLPLIIIGKDFFLLFVSKNWYILIFFLIIILGINIYFRMKWRLFSLLESENWHELIDYLENEIYERNRIHNDSVKILLNAYLITSRLDSIKKLEAYLNDKEPNLVVRHSLAFSVPYLLKSQPEEGEKFFGKILSYSNLKEKDWMRWNYAFSLMQRKQFEAARVQLLEIYESGKKYLPYLLALYFLNSYGRYDNEIREKVELGRKKLIKEPRMKKLKKEISSAGDNMEALILTQIIEEAYSWLNETDSSSLSK